MEPKVYLSTVNELGTGPSAMALLENNFDLNALRPWKEVDQQGKVTGRNFITINTGRIDDKGKPVYKSFRTNAPALLRREDWLRIDEKVQWAAKLRLNFAADVRGTNPYDIPDGLSVIAIQHAVATGDADAVISMDGMRESERARPVLDVGLLPLPIIHSDGGFSFREVAVSKRSGMPLDTTGIALSSRKVNEVVEQLYLGTWPAYSYAGGTIYGARNFPQRVTMVMTTPSGGWTPQTTLTEVLSMIQTLENTQYYGPYALYISTGWGKFFDQDYIATYPTGTTLRSRLAGVEKIRKITTVDYLPDYEMLLVQMTPDVVEGVEGMPLRVVQWQSGSGMAVNFKVMTINVPRFRSNYRGQAGIVHAVASPGGTTTTTTTTTTT